MITLINASAFHSDECDSTPLTLEGCQAYLAQYASSKIRLWAYNCSLSRLVLRLDRPAREGLRPIDLVFVSVSDVRCPVHWVFGAIEICHEPESQRSLFSVPSAGVVITAANLTIVVQDEFPQKVWELDSSEPPASRA